MKHTAYAALLVLLAACDGGDPAARPPIDWVAIPAGAFWMGCKPGDTACWSNETPQHAVHLSAFALMRRPVTVAEYGACVQAGTCTAPNRSDPWCSGAQARYHTWLTPGSDQRPVNCVTWAQAAGFCAWVGGRLPSEAQWELAARGACPGEPDPACRSAMPLYPWGDATPTCDLAVMATQVGETTVFGCGEDRIWPVGSRPAGRSVYGLDDMAGNVWQWTGDWHTLFVDDSEVDPRGPPTGIVRVIRGGAFHEVGEHLRSSQRGTAVPGEAYRSVGVRCAR